jgi:hypothetical protein
VASQAQRFYLAARCAGKEIRREVVGNSQRQKPTNAQALGLDHVGVFAYSVASEALE